MMSQVSEYRLTRRFLFLGKEIVVYNCPSCRGALESDLPEAGRTDTCPFCNCSFQVPGVEILQKRERKRQERLLAKEKKERERIEKIREQEQAAEEAKQKKLAELRERELAAEQAEKERRIKLLQQALTENFRYFMIEGCIYTYDEHIKEWRQATQDEVARLNRRLADSFQYIRIDGIYYRYIEARGWRSVTRFESATIRHAENQGGRPWFDGPIISLNHGKVIVIPYLKADGTKVFGHTKNPPGEGHAKPRLTARELTRDEVDQYKYDPPEED